MNRPLASRDLWSAVLTFALAGFIAGFGLELRTGTAARMGPGYAPMLIAAALAAFGVLFLVRAIVSRTSEPPEPAVFRPVLIVLGAMLAFGLLVERAGLFLALVACIGIAGLAAHERKPLQITLLALGLSATICLVFVTLLGLPIRLFPRFG